MISSKNSKLKVCHISAAHHGLDSRIYFKECKTLSEADFQTHLVISATSEEVEFAASQGIFLHPLPYYSQGRIGRFFIKTYKAYLVSKKIDADIYHIHDPELILYGFLLHLSGKVVIYDAHEDFCLDLISKKWITPVFKFVCKYLYRFYEKHATNFFHIVSATPPISRNFFFNSKLNIVVHNYSQHKEWKINLNSNNFKRNICYIGSITRDRGIFEMIEATSFFNGEIKLDLCGNFDETIDLGEISTLPGWKNVNYHGYLTRGEIPFILEKSFAGLLLLRGTPSFKESLPIKMFEYMSKGVPIICSDFPRWKKIVVDNNCGIAVDETNTQLIFQAINELFMNPKKREVMGANGIELVLEKFNWDSEAKKLLNLYSKVIV